MSILGQALRRTSPPPRPGVTVEILGHAWPGEFAPVIGHAADGTLATIRVLGEGSFPEPKSLPHELMARAKLDSEWVRARGVVRSLAAWPNLDEQRLLVDLSTEVGRLKLVVAGWRQESTPTNWVDALVEVEGVLGGEFGPRRVFEPPPALVPAPKHCPLFEKPPPVANHLIWRCWITTCPAWMASPYPMRFARKNSGTRRGSSS